MTTEYPTPGSPTNVRRSSYRGATYLKIRWNAPSTKYVTHYRVQYTKKNDRDDPWHIKTTKRPNKLSAVVRNLIPDTDYLFCVQSANGHVCGGTSDTIELDTRWSKAAKVVATPGVVVGTTLATPFVGGAAAAQAVWEKIEPENPVTGFFTGILSLATGVLAGVGSVVLAPAVGVYAAVELHDESRNSPLSSEDD